MIQLTTSRLMLHVFLLIVLAGYLLWVEVSYAQLGFSLVMFVIAYLIYLSSIAIENMKPQPHVMSVRGKKAIVTGGNSGIGFALAKQILSSGCSHLVLVARNEERLRTCVDELNKMKSEEQNVSYLSVDLSSDSDYVSEKVKNLCESMGGIDILVNCAGYSVPGEFKNLECKTFKTMVDTNYLGSVYITQAVVPLMIKQNFGQVVFLCSVGGQLGIYGFTAYSASKYAVRGFAEVLYSELRPLGIGVSLVFPPDTETPGFEKENLHKPKLTQMISEQGGLWTSDDVAKNILNGIENRRFMIGCGSDGFFVNALTCGAAPAASTLEFWIQCFLMPFLRIYMLFMQNYFTNMITNEVEQQKKEN